MPKRSRKEKIVEKRAKRQLLDNSLKTDWTDLEGEENADLESLPRQFKQDNFDDDESLPVIVNGQVRRVKKTAAEQESESEDESEEEEATVECGPADEPGKDRLSDVEVKEKIAEFAELINEAPEDNLGKLKELVKLATHTNRARIRQILLFSLLTLFKDLIPGYRIKPLTEAQLKEKVSKDVRKMREYEQQFLVTYKAYVDLLVQSFQQGRSEAQGRKFAVATSATYVACDLLESMPYFNFRQELIRIVVDKLSSQRVDKCFLQCIDVIQRLFQQDTEGHVSVELVQSLCKMIKTRRYKVDSRVLGTLVHLRLLTELVGRADLERMIKEKPTAEVVKKKDRIHLTRKQRKARKEQKEIDEEMRKAETAVSVEMREKLQAQTLKLVFILYFNVLKERSKTLLGAALEGLARFAHLINADLFGDLLEVLREIVSTQENATSRVSLLCIVTAFALLSGQTGESMNLDLSFFINELYKIIYIMALDPHIEQSHKHLASVHKGKLASETDMMTRAFEALFTKRSTASRSRVLAFFKRLVVFTLYFPERTSLISLNILTQMSQQYPYLSALFSTQDRVSKGVYNMDANVPEHSNAEVSTIWETALLTRHYNPRIAEAANGLVAKLRA